MEWWVVLTMMLGGLFLLFGLSLPVAFSFFLMNLLGTYFLMGTNVAGFMQMILGSANAISTFTLLPIPLFIVMGEILWHSGAGAPAIEVLDKLLGRLPGRLSLISVIAGSIFASVSGSNVANCALLGSVLAQPMADKGYKKPMILGPIIASGGLAMMIPPSGMGVFLSAIAMISVGKLLMALILPGFLLAILYAIYIIVVCYFKPDLAPPYEVAKTPLSEIMIDIIKYLVPIFIIIFLTVVTIFLGIATPTESASLGCVGSAILGYVHSRFKWLKQAVISAIKISTMVLFIVASASTFSQLLAYSGASRALLENLTNIGLSPIWILILMHLGLFILGGPMEETSILMVSMPIFMPIVQALGFDPIWFGITVMLNMELAILSPPFGMVLFVMKGAASKDTTMMDIYKSVIPFMGLQALTLTLVFIFPQIAMWIPNMMLAPVK